MNNSPSGKTGSFKVAQRFPIIFLPGIMGTRLRFRNGILWDPKSLTSLRHMAWNYALSSVETIRKNLTIKFASTILIDSDHIPLKENIYLSLTPNGPRKWGSLVWNFYGKIVTELEYFKFTGAKCPVYACGYDWRKTNANSADTLRKEIARVLELENASRVIIITHSMGGLVARSYIEKNGEDKVLSIIHITQPVHGAVVLYRRFKTGGIKEHDDVMKYLIGTNSPSKAATLLSSLPGAIELLPNNEYGKKNEPYWLKWDEKIIKKQTPPNDSYSDVYLDKSGKIGLAQSTFKYWSDIETSVDNAKKFHDKVAKKFHSKTYWICSNGLPTDTMVQILPIEYETITKRFGRGADYMEVEQTNIKPFKGNKDTDGHDDTNTGLRIVHHYPNYGDGTVPLASQVGYKENRSGFHVKPKGESQVDDVVHDQACNDDTVIDTVKKMINESINEFCKEKNQK